MLGLGTGLMTEGNVELSVIVPVYKSEANIESLIKAIDASIVARIQQPVEVVFVVDGSPHRSIAHTTAG